METSGRKGLHGGDRTEKREIRREKEEVEEEVRGR